MFLLLATLSRPSSLAFLRFYRCLYFFLFLGQVSDFDGFFCQECGYDKSMLKISSLFECDMIIHDNGYGGSGRKRARQVQCRWCKRR